MNQIARLVQDTSKAKIRVAPYTAIHLHWRIRPTTQGSELWSHCVQLPHCTSVQCTDLVCISKRITLLKMEIDSMFLLDTNPLLKFLIFEGEKMCVNEIFGGREKMGNSTRFFLSCWNNRASFMIISEYCLKHFGTYWMIFETILKNN